MVRLIKARILFAEGEAVRWAVVADADAAATEPLPASAVICSGTSPEQAIEGALDQLRQVLIAQYLAFADPGAAGGGAPPQPAA